jgi:predicted aspartyl protease
VNSFHRDFISLVVVSIGAGFGSLAAQDQPVAPINFELKNGFVIVARGSVGKLSNLVFIVDTGTSRTIVDVRIAEQLQLKSTPHKLMILDHDADAKLVELPSLQLGPIYAQSPQVIAINLSDVARQFGIQADVIVGMDILCRHSFTIDYKLGQIQFGLLEAFRHSVQLEHQAAPYLVVEVRINGRVFPLMVDTGFDGLVLFSNHLPKETKQFGFEIQRTGSSPAGQVSLRQATLAKVRIGDSKVHKVRPLVVETGERDMGAFAGILGARVLQSSCIRFDYQTMTLSWK